MLQKKTKIYIITECPYVGILTTILELSRVLKHMGFTIVYLLPDKERNRYGEVQSENELLLKKYGEIVHISLRRKYRFILSDTLGLWKKMKELQGSNDIVISYTAYAGKITRLMYFFGLHKKIFHSHNCVQNKRFSGVQRILEWSFERLLANQAEFYLSVGSSETKILVEELKVGLHKILFFPNFRSEISNSSSLEEKKYRYKFIYVGRMVKDKGVGKILSVFKSLNLLNQCIFIGDGPDLNQLRSTYSETTFTGRLPNSDVFTYLKLSKFYISASQMEGLPYGVIEAMGEGVVPLISNVEGHRDLILDGINGFLFDDISGLYDLLFKTEFIGDSEYLRLSENAAKTAIKLKEIGMQNIYNYFHNIT